MGINRIEEIIENNLCTGCGTCAGVCPKGAIDMHLNKNTGRYIPLVDKAGCTNCGMCVKTCPGFEVDIKGIMEQVIDGEKEDLFLGRFIECYSGYSTSEEIRKNSASGGLVTQLLLYLLESGRIHGALVTQMDRGTPLEPKTSIARSREQIIAAATSKYCPVPLNSALRHIIHAQDDERFAIVGLPCHIHGLRKAEQLIPSVGRKVLFRFGLFCGGSPSFLGTEFLLYVLGIKPENVVELRYRGDGWPGNLCVSCKDGTIIKKQFPAVSWDLLPKDTVGNVVSAFYPFRCFLCIDGTCFLSDVSLGDAWLEEFSWDRMGHSLVIVRTKRMKDILTEAMKEGFIFLKSIEAIKAKQSVPKRMTNFRARAALQKLVYGKAPLYNYGVPESPLSSYIRCILSVIRVKLLSIKKLWWFYRWCRKAQLLRKLMKI